MSEMTKDKELIERLARESFTYFGKTINDPLAVAICNRFLAAYLAERGKEAVDAVLLEDMVDGLHNDYGPGLFATHNCVTQVFLAPRPAVPEGKYSDVCVKWHDAVDRLMGSNQAINDLQAKIDALMFEYCPAGMTPEQIANYERNIAAAGVAP